jgi:hypothetical protein
MVEHIHDHMQVGFPSFESRMRKIEDNSVKLSVHQVGATIHCFCIDAMQNLGSQSFQLCDI